MAKRALSDLTVIELGGFVSAPYCGKLLADMGARVVKVETPEFGDKARRTGPFFHDSPGRELSGLFLYLNTSKLGITLNIETVTGLGILKELLKSADILIHNDRQRMQRLGLDYKHLKDINPRLIVTSISYFGDSGPYSDYKGSELIAFHAGGLGYTTPRQVKNIETDQPLKAAGRQADMISGLLASVATMCAVRERNATGRGQQVEVSEQESIGFLVQRVVPIYTYSNKIIERAGEALAGFVAQVPCKDGYFCFEPPLDHQFQALAKVMGSPEWTQADMCKDHASRARNWERIVALIGEWAADYTKDQIWEMAQASRVPGMPVNDMADLASSDQLQAREFFAEIDHPATGPVRYPGAPYKLSATPWQASPAPQLGQHNTEIIGAQLGWPPEELVRLKQAGVI